MTGAPVPSPAVVLVDQTLIVAAREEVARHLAAPARWRSWWPDLQLTVTRDRGLDGIMWSVAGALSGTAEIWLEPWHDGVIVHWILRASPRHPAAPDRVQRAYARSFKRRITASKDELEGRRPPGTPR